MKKILMTIFKLAITVFIIAYIINKLGFDKIVTTITLAKFEWLLVGIAMFGISGLLGVVQWKMLLSTKGIHLSYGKACKLYFMGMFFNNFIFGVAAGDAVRVTYIKLNNGSGKAGIAATFLDRFAGLWAMMGFAFVGSIILLNRGVIEGKALTTAFLALSATFILFCSILAFLISTRLQKILFRLIDNIPLPQKDLIRNLISQTIVETKDRGLIARIAGLSLVIQLLRVGVHIVCGMSLGILTTTNFQYFFIFVPILAILMIIPLPFGIKESVGGTLFAFAGFKPDAALVMEFLASIVGILVSSIGGIFFLSNNLIPKRTVSTNENINSSTAVQ